MIPTLLATLALVSAPQQAPQQAPDLVTLIRVTLEQCGAGRDLVVNGVLDVSDADWARPFRNDRACGLTAEGWTGDDGALVAAVRAAVGAEEPDWSGSVRELRVNESGPALWTTLEQIEGWSPASLLVIEPTAGRVGSVEIHYDPAG